MLTKSFLNSLLSTRVLVAMLFALGVPLVGIVMTDAPEIWPISTLLYNIGLLWFFSVGSKRLGKVFIYDLIAAALFLVEVSFFVSYYLQNTGFNDAFFYHLRGDIFHAGLSEFLPLTVAVSVCLISFIAIASYNIVNCNDIKLKYAPLFLSLFIFGLIISPPAKAIINYLSNSSKEISDKELYKNFNEIRGNNVSIDFQGTERPNIVLIYAESLEHQYFDENVFPGLVPNLKKLREQSVDFTNVSQGVGAEWTVAGIVASQCGYPLAGAHDIGGNEIGMLDEFMPKANCLGDLLAQDGYRLTFVGGADARFAGKGNFLQSHGYSEIHGRRDLISTLSDPSYLNPWGLYDDSMLDYAFGKFTELSRDKKPFLLTVLTIDTHQPAGYLSKSCGTYGNGENSSLNCVHCADALIPQFIEKIRRSDHSRNTIIVVLSDHLTIRNQASELLETSELPRKLTFFINTPDGHFSANNNPGLHYDIAPTILDFIGYNIKGQMGFGLPLTRGSGYLTKKFGEDGWEKYSRDLLAISKTLWSNEAILDKNGIKFYASNLSFVMGGNTFKVHEFEGYSNQPAQSIFLFDQNTLKLEKVKSYLFDQRVPQEALIKELLNNQEKLALVIGKVKYLYGFVDPSYQPEQWAFFIGRPGSDIVQNGLIRGDFEMPYSMIQKLSHAQMNLNAISERKNILEKIIEFKLSKES